MCLCHYCNACVTLTVRVRGHMNRIIWVHLEEKSQQVDKTSIEIICLMFIAATLPIILALAEMNNAGFQICF